MGPVAADASGGSIMALAAAAWSVSAATTAVAIRYAHRRRLLDMPGRRRSHRVPTPRGGGIGIVAAALAFVAGSPVVTASPWSSATALFAAIGLTGAVGWVDDHGGLAARWRFVAHWFAAALLLAATAENLVPDRWRPVPAAPGVAAGLVVAFCIVWSINLHNFMDGIDGLLSMHATFVFAALAVLLQQAPSDSSDGISLAVFAAATLGFVPFNFPRARIFMGDVGSGVIGLLIAAALLWQLSSPRIALLSGAVLCSAFVTDATATLVSRVWRGRRWYSAHREHLYQWLVRCGFPHAAVVAIYMAWNLLVVLPVVYWMNLGPQPGASASQDGTPTPLGLAGFAIAYGLATGAWWLGKRRCLGHLRSRKRHAAA